MAFIYDILPNNGDVHDTSPYWFAAFVRFFVRDTFKRSTMFNKPQNSSRLFPEEAIEEHPTLLIADNTITNWSVTSSKSSHVSSCSLTLNNSDFNWVSEVAPGDWMGFWAFDNRDDYLRVLKLVKERKQANGFMDGLKFIGRVEAPRRLRSRAPNGQLSVKYSISGTGFSEFDTTMYYNEYFVAKYGNDALLWMMNFGTGANNLILASTHHKGLLTSQLVMPKLLNICFGVTEAPPSNNPVSDASLPITIPGPSNALLQGSVNKAYLVPPTIGNWLGSEPAVKDSLSYVDLLRTYIGVQTYSNSGVGNRNSPNLAIKGMMPDYENLKQNVYQMLHDLTGEYRVLTIHSQTSMWSLLHTYINEPIDEMYTCMRADHEGNVRPTIVMRQTPFSTHWLANNFFWPVTDFTTLPRWRISSDMVQEENVGRSNALRFNFMHFMGQDMTGANGADNNVINFVRSPPIVDPSDISRSGLRMFNKQLNSNVNEAQYNNDKSPGAKWQEIVADALMGGHLKYTGSLTLRGIQEPICEGDNAEWDNTIYHIEGVTHSGSISVMGTKDFTTTLQLTNGIDISNEGDFEDFSEIKYPELGVDVDVATTETE